MFQSTHPQGVRHRPPKAYYWLLWFQSTHPQGVRRKDASGFVPIEIVSIHAPAGGATVGPEGITTLWTSFNPRTRRGCDNVLGLSCSILVCFNPRTRRGCDWH